MLYEVDWAEDGTYVPGEEFSPERFFNDGLKNSTEFDLKLGYFSSAAISVLAEGFATFISRGGHMRLIINHIVSTKDKEAITNGMMGDIIDCADLSNFQYLKTTFNEYQEQFFRCLAYIISQKRIDIRIIKPKGSKGIAHTKSGQFRDGDSTTAFTGSANFTINGFFTNIEEIKIDRSDSIDKMVQKRIAKQKKDFDSIMSGEKKGIEYLSPKDLVEAISINYGDSDIEELLDVEKKLRIIREEKEIQERQETIDTVNESIELEPRFPYPSGPRDYQKTAFENWKNNGQKGLFAMATGTGKTLTSLNCLLMIYNKFHFYKAIILVPTITLVDQWEEECKKFNFEHIIKVSSKNPNWASELDSVKMSEDFGYNKDTLSYIIIATYASFAREKIFKELTDFSPKTCRQMLFIADEAHNLGAGRTLKRLDRIKFPRRIGLSATPDRQFDEEGNKAIAEFFGCQNGYTFEYQMKEAINNGFLCRYKYYPHLVQLNDEEMSEYMKISLQLSKFFNKDSLSFPKSDDILMRLLLKRKRIIHKAKNKEDIFRKIVQQRYAENGNLKYTLVYVPEGSRPDDYNADIFEATDDIKNDDYTDNLIDTYTQIVHDVSRTTTVKKFTAGLKNRKEILDAYSKGEIEVLTSMKCLDEGVDVPRSEMAIFCASTGNPRQFIQRRGRILRTHPEKKMAYIHDLVVAPEISPGQENYNMERSMLQNELKRVRDFAVLSENADYAYNELDDILSYYNIPFF